jgi:hypothetical protein
MSRLNRKPVFLVATQIGAAPIWMPINYLFIESLQQFHHCYGDDFKVECPTGSGRYLTEHGRIIGASFP